jgi:hypothetical protein
VQRSKARRALAIMAMLPATLLAAAPSSASSEPAVVIASSTYLSPVGSERTEMTVTNLGYEATTLAIPATTTGPGAADAGSYDPGTGIWSIDQLAAGATATLRFPGD